MGVSQIGPTGALKESLGGGVIFRKTTAAAATNTVAETDLLAGALTVGANSIGTSGLVRLTAFGDFIQNSGGNVSAQPRFKVKMGAGATVVIDTGIGGAANVLTTSAVRGGWKAVVEIMNLGAANSQWINFWLQIAYPGGNINAIGNSSFTTGEGSFHTSANAAGAGSGWAEGGGSATIDTTAATAVVLSVINPTATATCETKLFSAIAEIL